MSKKPTRGGKGGVQFITSGSQSNTEEKGTRGRSLEAGAWRQELRQRPRRVLLPGLLSLSHRTQGRSQPVGPNPFGGGGGCWGHPRPPENTDIYIVIDDSIIYGWGHNVRNGIQGWQRRGG